MNYYISDLHIGHANIINFDNRPFSNLKEMHETIIRNWNNAVKPGDMVYILGDMIWDKESQWPSWLEQLTGNKVLIRGNHDPKEFSHTIKGYFHEIINLKEIVDNGRHVIMCHYPIPFHRSDYDTNFYMLYGHVHATREYEIIEALRKELRESRSESSHARGQFINVGCMMPWMDYTPRTLDEIIAGDNIHRWLRNQS